MSEHHVTIVQGIYESFGQGDFPAILDKLSDDVCWDHDGDSWGLPWYEARTGREGVAAFFPAVMEGLVLHRLDPVNFLTGGSQVAVVIEVEAEVKGAGGVKTEQEIHLWTFDDAGKICRFAHVIDRHWQVSQYRGVEA